MLNRPVNGAGMPPNAEPRRAVAQIREALLRVGLGDRRRAAAAVDEHEPRQALGARLAGEVPRRVGGGDRAAERVAADDDLAAELLRAQHDAAQVADLDVHAPLPRVADLAVRDQPHVRRDRAVLDPAEVVVEHLLRRRLARLRAVEHRLVLEQVLAPLDRPHLPLRRLGDDALGQRREVRGARGRARGSARARCARCGDPILRMPTLSYLAGVPGDLTPSMRWKLTFAAAGAAATRISALARDSARAGVVMGGHFRERMRSSTRTCLGFRSMADAITVIATRDEDAALLIDALSRATEEVVFEPERRALHLRRRRPRGRGAARGRAARRARRAACRARRAAAADLRRSRA